MPEDSANPATFDSLSQLKYNRTGELYIKNGQLAIDTGTNVYYTAVVGDDDNEAEAAGPAELSKVQYPYSTATGKLRADKPKLQIGVERNADTIICIDRSGSMGVDNKLTDAQNAAKTYVDELNDSVKVGLVSFADSASVNATLDDDRTTVKNQIDNLTDGGSTNMSEGISTADTEVRNGTGSRSGVDKSLLVLADGEADDNLNTVQAATDAKYNGTRIYGIGFQVSSTAEALIEDISSPPKDDDGNVTGTDENAFLAGDSGLPQVMDIISDDIGLRLNNITLTN